MKLLFDTHVFIWWHSDPDRLTERVRTACTDPANELVVSVVSAWEMQIKSALGKLELDEPLADIFETQVAANGFVVLDVQLEHVYELANLADHHKDPFDRLLVAQAHVEAATLLSADPAVAAYEVDVLW